MQEMILSFGADIETHNAKPIQAIVKRFCKAYDMVLISFEGPFAYTQDHSLAQVRVQIQYKDYGQFKKGFEAEYITGLIENCFYLQCNWMFNTYDSEVKHV